LICCGQSCTGTGSAASTSVFHHCHSTIVPNSFRRLSPTAYSLISLRLLEITQLKTNENNIPHLPVSHVPLNAVLLMNDKLQVMRKRFLVHLCVLKKITEILNQDTSCSSSDFKFLSCEYEAGLLRVSVCHLMLQ
jgi:hypothetical protein